MAGKQVLIVDDDKDIVSTLKLILESAGYRTTSAANGTEAWDKAQKAPPDLAIVDVVMDSVGEGVQLTHRFRADQKLKDMPIIMLTGIRQKVGLDLRPGPQESYDYLPVDKFLEKPVDPKLLLRTVADLL